MKIEKTSKPALAPATTSDANSRGAIARTSGSQTPATGNSETSVHIGSTTAQLQSLQSGVASSPVVDTKKVSEIKQAISDGRFKVNSGAVADRLINSVQDLISASNR